MSQASARSLRVVLSPDDANIDAAVSRISARRSLAGIAERSLGSYQDPRAGELNLLTKHSVSHLVYARSPKEGRVPRQARLAVVAAVLALVIGACSSSPKPSAAGTTTTSAGLLGGSTTTIQANVPTYTIGVLTDLTG